MYTLLKYIVSNLIYSVIREVIVYRGLILTSVLILITLVQAIIYHSRSDKDQIVKTFKYINLGVSVFGLLFVILDPTLHFFHNVIRLTKRVKKGRLWFNKMMIRQLNIAQSAVLTITKVGSLKSLSVLWILLAFSYWKLSTILTVVNASVDLYLIIESRNQRYDIEQLIKELRENEGR